MERLVLFNLAAVGYFWIPMDPPPFASPPPVPSTTGKGSGCFVKGCLIVIGVGLLLAAIAGAGGWYLYGKAIDLFTASHAVDVRIEQPSDAIFQVAEQKLDRLRRTTSNNQEATIQFSASDLNALVVRDPNFRGAKNRVRIAMSDSAMVLDLSVPLDSCPLPRLKGRWFNGVTRFGFSFGRDEFFFNTQSVTANGHELPEEFCRGFNPSFTRGFNKSFQRGRQSNGRGNFFWRRIKTISVEGDKLVVTTQRS